MAKAHVFLGPSLDLKTASAVFPEACYHPPIQCGDLIRLFRLDPELIVVIDGIYETTPAVWHKEILLAMEMGIEVWGTASMGALRAAELHPYGMQGFGDVFQDFKDGTLADDDEVAVLHLGEEEQFAPINDAMVNIRATCQKAGEENILTQEAKKELLSHCKAQFYPYRSLKKAIEHLSRSNPTPYLLFSQWLETYGIIDVKKKDALATLKHLHARHSLSLQKSEPLNPLRSMTCFLRELILFANTTPFKHRADWLPDVEKQLHALHQHSPMEYMLLAEIAAFVQKLVVFSSSEKQAIENSALIDYMQKNQLYSPENDFMIYKEHPILADVYSLICQSICLLHLTTQQLNDYLPALAHYYDLTPIISDQSTKKLRIILVLLFSINQQIEQPHLLISKRCVTHHLKQLKNWRQYTQAEFKNWLANTPGTRLSFTSLLNAYLMASSLPALSMEKIEYYRWIYDVHAMCCDIPSPAVSQESALVEG